MAKSKKYFYDYPSNRELGQLLTISEREEIAEYLHVSKEYIYQIFIIGRRTNKKAIDIAKIIIEQKQKIKTNRINKINRILNK
ncbi:MAG: hypothetical protein IMY72_11940 [Bacteroidetes bacterium]|nr:hypothetical protein [Bacteroidota bacterium]